MNFIYSKDLNIFFPAPQIGISNHPANLKLSSLLDLSFSVLFVGVINITVVGSLTLVHFMRKLFDYYISSNFMLAVQVVQKRIY
jgi:hypothetical protein